MENVTLDLKWVANLLNVLNVYKASGPDGMNARVLKECSNEMSLTLALITELELMYQTTGKKKIVLLFFFSLFLKMKTIMLLIVDQCRSQASVAQPYQSNIKDNVIHNMAWWLKSAGALNFALSQEQCPISL